MAMRLMRMMSFFALVIFWGSLANAQNLVKIVVEQNLFNMLRGELAQYKTDLETEGYKVSTVAGTWSSPEAIRALLQNELSNGLVGAVLIGDIPLAKFNLRDEVGNSYWHEFHAPFFFMDLDGEWGDRVGDVYTSHRGNVSAEIWVGVIRADHLPSAGNQEELLRKYFAKIHNYRHGKHYRPPFRAFQLYYTIKPSYANPQLIYPAVFNVGCNVKSSDLQALLHDQLGYDFAVINAVSGYNTHHFHFFTGESIPPEELTIDHGSNDVHYRDVLAANPKILFFHLATSETGQIEQNENLGGHYVFGGDYGLVALAATQHFITGDNFYAPLAAGMSFGEAFKTDMNSFSSRYQSEEIRVIDWCAGQGADGPSEETPTRRFYAAILLGDPTLHVNEPEPDSEESLPQNPKLIQNYPNPFILSAEEFSTTIRFLLAEPMQVEIGIYNVRGQRIRTLANRVFPAGAQQLVWDGLEETGFPASSGVYFYRLQAGNFTATKKMVLIE